MRISDWSSDVCSSDLMDSARWRFLLFFVLAAMSFVFATGEAMAHAVAEGDKGYIQEISGVNILAFMYLGAKHMVTGYDHILFLFGIIFFLYRDRKRTRLNSSHSCESRMPSSALKNK